MAEIKIDSQLFQERISHFVSSWKNDARSKDGLFNGASSILILMGKAEDSQDFHKNNAMHFWLLGYEFPATLMLFTMDCLYIVTTAKKAKHLEQLKGGRFPIEILVRGKDAAENEKSFVKIADTIKAAGNKIGTLAKDTSRGPFIEEWKKTFADQCKDVTEVDISQTLSVAAFSVKDETELRAMRTSSKACVALMTPYFLEEMSNILDQEKKVKHSTLADKVDKKLDDDKFWKTVQLPNKSKLPSDLDPTQLDWVTGPIVQSGGAYDLKLSTEANDNFLHAGTIIAAMGLRYKSYSSAIARTYLIDPNKSQEGNYKLLCNVHNTVLKEIRDGAVAKDVYHKALSTIRSKKPEMEKHFLRNVGWGIGLETKDTTMVLNGKNGRTLKDGMTLCITTGFSDIENPNPQDKNSKIYSLMIMDTIRVTSTDPVVFTQEAPIEANSNSFFFKDEEEAQPTPKKEKKDHRVGAVATKNITQTRLRSERTTQVEDDADTKRRQHQQTLAAKKQKEGTQRYAESTGGQNGVEAKTFKKFESYKRDNQLPLKVRDLKIIVDVKSSTVIVPVMGHPVPFHINTIKNASVNDEGDWDATAHFVRSLTFRSEHKERYTEIANQISNMKRDVVKKEQEKKDMEDVVEQDKLVEIRSESPPPVLDNVFIRPAMEGKRVPGKLEIHQNGIRYQSPLSTQQRVDILFSNVRHLFFQPCQHELIVVIHIHLKDPIIVGNKKKTKDVQFYREATDIQFDETGNRRRKYRYGDEDEFEQEQEERRQLGFHGVPFRSNVFIQPTTDCLIQVVEPPFMVLTLEDIEIAHLERVQFGLKNFDLVFVFKDYSRAPYHINTIPMEQIEDVKDWLDNSDILYSEGPLNLSWPTIMKTVTADPHQFFQDGGWSFLQQESDDEGGSDEEDEESAFEIDDDDLDAASESSEEDSDYGSNVSDEDDEDEAELSDDDEGDDWDEMEEKAKKRDRESGLDDEDRGRKKRKH
ncbi:unnamed protein product [Parascedosporium putredinis]|uniref:FACT complex subunit n=1 Tax=Parascedosporium putredinis TaxID=1442378 RepID=A0A9P1H343_9PEZI|nr:unnamed protein product [Parascedosporium putredinis]CAI7995516.1 unnamed protein product [Parascedosporium putredinis]